MRYFNLLLLLFVFGLIGCSVPIEDVPITVIVDHKIQPSLKDNDSIYKLIEPEQFDSFLLNIVPKFIKIDVSPPIEDSIRTDESWIKSMQVWFGGGRKNSKYFKKTRIKEIEKSALQNNFENDGNITNRDSFFKNNNAKYILYSNNNNLIKTFRELNPRIQVFSSISSLRNYIITSKDSILQNKDTLKIYFDPKFEQQRSFDSIEIPKEQTHTPPKKTSVVILERVIETQKVNHPQTKVECDDPTKRKIVSCKNMNVNESKAIHFFNTIFRFTKNSECSYSEYLHLLNEIYTYILNRPPSFNQGNNTYYNIVCSNRTDFLLELRKYNISVSEQEYNNAFQNCPSNSF